MLEVATGFAAQTFEFRCEVTESVVLNEHKGSALRGALFHSLRKVGCSRLELKSCRGCTLVQVCPVSFLLATVDDEAKRGGDVPRPFTINPPLQSKNIFQPGDNFTFGLTLFARPANFWPYLVVALEQMEREGLGAKFEQRPGQWRRGSIRVQEIVARNILSDEEQVLFEPGSRQVALPQLPVDMAQISQVIGHSEAQAVRKLHLDFLTPTRLIVNRKPLQYPDFAVLVQRLIERLSSLSAEYGEAELGLDFEDIMAEARAVRLVEDRTRWQSVRGYSQRQHQDLSLSGFVGRASFVGRVDKVLPLLLWGQLTHVGKDATKGNGWYALKFEEEAKV